MAIHVPRCPSHLAPEAKREWKRTAPKLAAAGILTELDRAVLSAYCEAWGNYVQASQQVQKYGSVLPSPNGSVFQSPYINVLSMAMKQLREFASELGMSPSSRSQLHVTLPVEHDGKSQLFKVRCA